MENEDRPENFAAVERWGLVKSIVDQALDCDETERAAFLDRACEGDDGLRAEVESLLSYDSDRFPELSAGEMRERPPLDAGARMGPHQTVKSGTRIGHYTILSILGRGGMGEVWRARDSKLEREVAIKALPLEFGVSADLRARFKREAKMLAALNHPNIASVYGLEELGDASYIVLELVEGETLEEKISYGEPLRQEEVVNIALQIAEALESAHARGITHRDIKPANIKITPEGRVKVLDLGLAKNISVAADPNLSQQRLTVATEAGQVLGTPAYMSPEQARGEPTDFRTDVWAFGCVMFELLSGKQPFGSGNIADMHAAILEREPDWDALPRSTPDRVRELLRQCLEKNAERRLPSITDAIRELERLVAGQPFFQTASASARAHPLTSELPRASGGGEPRSHSSVSPDRDLHAATTTSDPMPNRPRSSVDAPGQSGIRAGLTEATSEGMATQLTLDATTGDTEEAPTPNPAVRWRSFGPAAVVLLILLLALSVGIHFSTRKPVGEQRVSGSTIAVLPFENRSPNEDDIFFVDGIHDDILAQLSKIRSIKVISRPSTERFKQSSLSVSEIGEMLNADVILNGAVQRSGERVRVTVQLISAVDDEQVWSETYDRTLNAEDIFRIQSEIAATVAVEMRATLTVAEQNRIDAKPTDNIEAYEAYLVGKSRIAQLTAASIREASQFFERAVALDPAFLLAQAWLAESIRLRHEYEERLDPTQLESALDAVNRVLEQDDELAPAYVIRGRIYHDLERWDEFGEDVSRALELNPNLADAYALNFDLLSFHRRQPDAALVQIRKALELDPMSGSYRRDLGQHYFGRGRRDEALEVYRRLLEVNPDDPVAPAFIGLIDGFARERLDKAVLWISRAAKLDPENPTYAAYVAAAYLDLNDLDAARGWLDRALVLGPDHYEPNDVAIFWNLYRGNLEQARNNAAKAFRQQPRYGSAIHLAVLRDQDIERDDELGALTRYETAYPELVGNTPTVNADNYRASIDLAYLLIRMDQIPRATNLLNLAMFVSEEVPQTGPGGSRFHEARALVLQSRLDDALEALKGTADNGASSLWRYYRDHDVVLSSLRTNPEFIQLIADIESKAASQLLLVRELESSGEIPAADQLP